jgi:hypothetical protein
MHTLCVISKMDIVAVVTLLLYAELTSAQNKICGVISKRKKYSKLAHTPKTQSNPTLHPTKETDSLFS